REFNIDDGEILIDGKKIQKLNLHAMRDMVGYVPQTHMLFRETVINNIRVGKPEADKNEFTKAIEIADFTKDIEFLSNGLESLVGEGGANLSGGQKQRLSIARAVIKNPEILILDDSLSAVDSTTEQNIISKLNEYRRHKTNIIIAHRFSAVKNAHKIYVMQNGTIEDEGTHEQLLSKDGWYKEQFIRQANEGVED
ncbi:MAG: ATP-binding cassette domain-containing protein, partial [Fusobacteriaceae bacterium]